MDIHVLLSTLKCSHNNRAATVLSVFTKAAQVHGLPNCVQSDLGGENFEVYIIEQHASQTAVITGSLTDNECTERLWQDVRRCVNVLFADAFHALEEEGILNCLNDVNMFCLHILLLQELMQHLLCLLILQQSSYFNSRQLNL